MQDIHLPRTDLRYWLAITGASILGANLGDFCAHTLGLGHVAGLPVLAVLFAALLLGERRFRPRTEAFYWGAIVVLRTSATMLGDFFTHDLKVGYPAFLIGLALVLALLALAQDRGCRPVVAAGKPNANALYWFAMLLAATLGTALGDACADLFGLACSGAVWGGIWGVGLLATLRIGAGRAVAYWAMIAVVRTLGTNLGDLLVGADGLALGLPLATAASAVLFGLLLACRPAIRRSAADLPG